MKTSKKQLKRIIREELMKEAGRPHSMRGGRTGADLDREAKMREKDFSKKHDPFTAVQDDFEALIDKHNIQDPIAVLDQLKDRWETMLADQENTDQEDGYI